jgi:hypothetical protein
MALPPQDRFDGYAVEIRPVAGNMVLFRVCDHSWHGHLPAEGERTCTQARLFERATIRRREQRRRTRHGCGASSE